MTGYTRDAVIGRSVYEIDVLEDAANREAATRAAERLDGPSRKPNPCCACRPAAANR